MICLPANIPTAAAGGRDGQKYGQEKNNRARKVGRGNDEGWTRWKRAIEKEKKKEVKNERASETEQDSPACYVASLAVASRLAVVSASRSIHVVFLTR